MASMGPPERTVAVPPPRPRRNWLGPVLILVLLAGVAAGGWWLFGRGGGEAAAQAKGQGGPPPPKVTVAAPLKHRLTEWDEFTGRFEAVDRVEVRARVAGYLERVHFTDGQIVKAGDLLFTIDQRPFIAAIDEAKAALAAAEVNVQQAQITEGRSERLRQTNSPAFQRANLEDQQQVRLGAQSQADAARAALARAQLDLDFSVVKAPVAGRVSDRRVDPGNLVGDSTLLTTIVSLDPIYLVFDMSEADFLAYQREVDSGAMMSTRDRGMVVGAKLADESDWTREGRMDFIDNAVDQGSGTIRGRGTFPNPGLLIAPGQFGTVRIPGSPEHEAILVPETAIVTDQSSKLVLILNAENKLEPRQIRVGPREGQLRIVRKGLDGTERVVINGLARVRPGMTVAPEDGKIEVEQMTQASR